MSTRSSIAYHECERGEFHLFVDVMNDTYGIEITTRDGECFFVLPDEFVYEIRDKIAENVPGPEHPARAR